MSAETVGALHLSPQGLPDKEELVAVCGVAGTRSYLFITETIDCLATTTHNYTHTRPLFTTFRVFGFYDLFYQFETRLSKS